MGSSTLNIIDLELKSDMGLSQLLRCSLILVLGFLARSLAPLSLCLELYKLESNHLHHLTTFLCLTFSSHFQTKTKIYIQPCEETS